jgi:peptidoglycan/LPS O-acetylase OafA/YrhL
MNYHPSLDGIRAIAVGTVLITHAGVPFGRSGWAGVDTFFTLSGFLITSILLAEQDRHGSVHVRYFYARRFLRLLPCLSLAVTAVVIAWVIRGRGNDIVKEALLSATYSMNWARGFGWIGDGPLEHTWTLAIEEQYYLLWPLLVGITCRTSLSRPMIGSCLLVFAAGITVYRLALVDDVPARRIHFGLDTHADPLLIGSALAYFSSNLRGRRLGHFWSRAVGYVLVPVASVIWLKVAFSWIVWHGPPALTVGYPIIAVATMIIVLDVTLGTHSVIRWFLELSLLVWVGRISYGVYVWHLPIFVALRTVGVSDWRLMLISGTGLTLVVSAVSYYLIERRFLQIKGLFSRSGASV